MNDFSVATFASPSDLAAFVQATAGITIYAIQPEGGGSGAWLLFYTV